MTLWLVGIVDAAIVLTIGLAIVLAARRRSASLRHAVLVAAIVSALLMPVLEVAVPQVPVIRWGPTASWFSASTFTSDAATPVSFDAQPPAPREADVSWMQLVAALWMGGSILLGTALIAGFVRLRRLKARCTPVAGRWRELTDELRPACGVARQVALLQSREPSLLITCGLLRPVIILPSESESWPEARCRAVLRHELAHIRRHDATVQIVGEILRAVHWVNPLAWVACRRLRQESEYACDDAVLMSGLEPAEYATHLIDVARQLSGRRAWLSVPAIAHPSTLERRIVAMLQKHPRRTPLSRTAWALAVCATLAIVLPLAAAGGAPAVDARHALSPAPEVPLPAPAVTRDVPSAAPVRVAPSAPGSTRPRPAQAGSIAGTIVDQTGGTLPGVQVTLTNVATGVQIALTTDARGQFAARDLAPGDYELVARLPAFATAINRVTLTAGGAIQGSLTLSLGTIQETVVVACTAAAAAAPRRLLGNATFPMSEGQVRTVSDGGQAIRVGGSVRPPKKVTDVRPSCPSAAATDINVRLTGRVTRDGTVADVAAVPSAAGEVPPQEFVAAAADAVREWKFTPTLLNGQAVEVGLTVEVKFVTR